MTSPQVLNYSAPQKILVVTKGHPFEHDPFFALFDAMDGVAWTHVEQPAAHALLDPRRTEAYDAIVFYDMGGIEFNPGGAPTYYEHQFKEEFVELLKAGKGCVFLHHAIAAWPSWPDYAEIVGGRFLYQPGTVRGVDCPDSGYRHEVKHHVSVVDPAHPVCAGVENGFEIVDELYLCEVFEQDVIPLLRSDYAFTRDNFYSADLAIRGTMFSNEGWQHSDGSNLIGWVKTAYNSPIVYLQCGDDPRAYGNENFQKLLKNAVQWVSSDEALNWAKEQG